jgi:hypothetical protein
VVARHANIGFHDDLFPEDTDGREEWKFLPTIRAAGRAEAWQRTAIGGEMGFRSENRWLGADYRWTQEMIEKAHLSYLGPYNPAAKSNSTPAYQARCREMVRRMGYEFALKEIRCPERVPAGTALEVRVEGTNRGVAPFYYPWPVELALLDNAGKVAERWATSADIRTWLPGGFRLDATRTLAAAPGRFRIALGIRDPLTGRPAIRFANELPIQDGWTVLAPIELTAAR